MSVLEAERSDARGAQKARCRRLEAMAGDDWDAAENRSGAVEASVEQKEGRGCRSGGAGCP